MDTSKEYIKMCEGAEEIQNIRYPDFFAGDWYISHNGYTFIVGSLPPLGEDLHRGGEVWLPRQDQLQEMVLPSTCNAYWLVNQINCMCYNDNAYGLCGNPSMEQLWLAFVMSKRFGKHWSGKEWESPPQPKVK